MPVSFFRTLLRPGAWQTGAFLSLLAPLAIGADDSADWRFELSPYAWVAGLKGEVGTLPGEPAAPIDVAPSDVIDNLDAVLMLIFNARRGRHGLYADIFYADIRAEEELIPPPVDLKLRIQAESTLATLAYQYEFFRHDGASAELLAGARYWQVDNLLRFGGGSGLLAGRRISSSESWTDPLLGIRGRMPLGESRFYLTGGGAVGGFGVGSDSFYELSGAIGYRWSDAIATAVGYRRYEVDYRDSGFSYDVTQQGWQFGLTWAF